MVNNYFTRSLRLPVAGDICFNYVVKKMPEFRTLICLFLA